MDKAHQAPLMTPIDTPDNTPDNTLNNTPDNTPDNKAAQINKAALMHAIIK